MTNSTPTKRASSPEQSVRFLSARLRESLALLRRGDDDVVSLALGALPRGSRLLLATLGAVETSPHDSAELVLTPYGRELAVCCALAGLSPELKKKRKALEQERAGRTARHSNRSIGESSPEDEDYISPGQERGC